MLMQHLDVSQDSKKVGSSSLQEKTVPLRKALKKIAQENSEFKPLLKYVASQVAGEAINEKTGFYFLLSKFNQYSSAEEIHEDIQLLHDQWKKECKTIKNNAVAAVGGLLIDMYRCYFLQAFCNKTLPTLPTSSPIAAVEAREFPSDFTASVKSVIDELQKTKLTKDSFVKKWVDEPFLSLDESRDHKTVLNELKDFNHQVETHRQAVIEAIKTSKELKAVSNASTVELVMEAEKNLSDLRNRFHGLSLEECRLSSTRVQLEAGIKELSDSYSSTLKSNEIIHTAELPSVLEKEKHDFSSELKQTDELKQLDEVLEKTKRKELYKKKYFQVKIPSSSLTLFLKTLHQGVFDFNIKYNDITAKGKEIDIIFEKMINAITKLLKERNEEENDDLEELIIKQQAEIAGIQFFYNEQEQLYQIKQNQLCAKANDALLNQLQREAMKLREERYKEHWNQCKKVLTPSEVEIKGVEELNKFLSVADGKLFDAKKKLKNTALTLNQKEFDDIKATPPDVMKEKEYKQELDAIQALSSSELKQSDLTQKIERNRNLLLKLSKDIELCSLKHDELNSFLRRMTNWCEAWDGVQGRSNEETETNTVDEVSQIPLEMKKFHKEVKKYLVEVHDQLERLKKAKLACDVQLQVSILESEIEKIKSERKEETADRYVVEVIHLRKLRQKILLYKEDYIEEKNQENKAIVDKGLSSLEQTLNNAMKHAIDKHTNIWDAKLTLESKADESNVDAQILQILSTQLLQDKTRVPHRSSDAKTEDRDNLSSFTALINLGKDIDNQGEDKKKFIIAAIKDEELAEAPQKKIDQLYGRRRKKTADVAFFVRDNFHKIAMPPLVEPKWSTFKFVLGLVLGVVVGAICYWCSYQSRKTQYERERAAWPLSIQRQAYSQVSASHVGGGSTTNVLSNGVNSQQKSVNGARPQQEEKRRVVMLPGAGAIRQSIADSKETEDESTPLLAIREMEGYLSTLNQPVEVIPRGIRI